MQPEPPADPSSGRASELSAQVDGLHLTVAAAARRLGIAPATLRTWDRRYGIGPTDHEPGRHRRYSPKDVARLELMQRALVRGATPVEAARVALAAQLSGPYPNRPEADDLIPSAPDGSVDGVGEETTQVRAGGRALRLSVSGSRARGLGRAALALDTVATRALLVESIADVGVEATWEDVARPVLSAIAERWAYTGAGIEIEHLLSECVIGVFGAIAADAPVAGPARPVLLTGMPGEQHVLPMVVLAATLALRGVACRSLGSDLPVDALVAAIRRTAPVAVVLWSQLTPTADTAVLLALPRTRPRARIFVAGPGWAGVDLPSHTVRLDSLGQATDLVGAAAAT